MSGDPTVRHWHLYGCSGGCELPVHECAPLAPPLACEKCGGTEARVDFHSGFTLLPDVPLRLVNADGGVPMTGYIPVGGGIGAAVLWDGRLNVVAGPLFAQIEQERRDGPRWCEAVREAGTIRHVPR